MGMYNFCVWDVSHDFLIALMKDFRPSCNKEASIFDAFFKPMKVKGYGFCLYSAVVSHIMSIRLHDIWTDRFPLVKKPGMKQATFEVVNDLKEFISQKDNEILQNVFDIHIDQEVNDFTKEKIDKWDFAMASMEMNMKHLRFGSHFGIFLVSMICKMQIIILKNDPKDLILGTDTDKLYSFLLFGDPPTRVHPPCRLYLLSYYFPTNPSYTNMFNR